MHVSGLYLVGTPIGNLQDITYRALEVLHHVDLIVCEDQRVTQVLTRTYGIHTSLFSYHDHNAAQKRPLLLEKLDGGQSIALVSDAGMPLISDPGYKLVEACWEKGIGVTVIPGASAVLTALCGSGLPAARFFFQGFLPSQASSRQTVLQEMSTLTATLIFFEAPHRILETLKVLKESLGERRAVLSRELTKKFEETRRGTFTDLIQSCQDCPPRGEITLVVEGAEAQPAVTPETLVLLIQEALQRLSLKEAVMHVCETTGLPRRLIYQKALEQKQTSTQQGTNGS